MEETVFWLIEVSVTNSYISYNLTKLDLPAKFSLLNFRDCLVFDMVSRLVEENAPARKQRRLFLAMLH